MFALKTIQAHPKEMKIRAVKSYFRINTSLRIRVDRTVAAMMDVAVFAESKIRLRYGIMLTWIPIEQAMINMPSKNLQEP